MFQDLLRRGILCFVQGLQHTVCPEQLLFGICRLRQAVGIQEELVSRIQGDLIFLVFDALHAADHKAVPVLVELEITVSLSDRGIFVAGVGRRDPARRNIQDPQPDRDEHLLLVVGADRRIGACENIGKRFARHNIVGQDDPGGHHKEGGRDPLAGDIRDHQAEVVLVDQEEVIKVSADLLGRMHGGKNIKGIVFRKGRELAGQHVRLDPGRQRELRPDPLPLRRDLCDAVDIVLDLLLHPVDGVRQVADLVLVAYGFRELVLRLHILGREPGGLPADHFEGIQQDPGQVDCLPRRHDQDGQKQQEKDPSHEEPALPHHDIHLLLHTHDPPGLTVRIPQGDHSRNMRICLYIAPVPEYQFLVRLSFIQIPVFGPVIVVGRLPDIAELVVLIGAVAVHRRKNKADMPVVRQIGLDHIDKGRSREIAEPLQPAGNCGVVLSLSAAGGIGLHPFRVNQGRSYLGRLKGSVRILVQNGCRDIVKAENTHDRGKNKEQGHDTADTFKRDPVSVIFHMGYLKSFPGNDRPQTIL